jgi:hypothetical protein
MATVRTLLETFGPSGTLLSPDATADVEASDSMLLGAGEDVPFAPGAVVLATGTPVIKERSGVAALVVKAADVPEGAAQSAFAVVSVNDELPLNHVAHLIGTSLVGTAVTTSLTGDLFALANTIAAMVGGAVAVEDPQRAILAYSTLPNQPIDEARQLGILGRRVPHHDRNDSDYRELVRRREVIRMAEEGPVLPRLAVAVRSGPEVLGFLWVVENDSMPADAAERLADAAELAAVQLLRARVGRAVERRARGEQLRHLFTGGTSADFVAARLGIAAARPVVVLGLALPTDVADRESEAEAVADLLLAHCSAISPRSAVLLELDRAYALVPAESLSRKQLGETAASVVSRARQALGVEIAAGVGSTVEGLHQSASSRVDVDAVLRVTSAGSSALLESVLPLVALNDLQVEILRNAHLRLPAVEALLEHDQQHDTPYAETVLAYLSAQHDVVAASQSLAIHQNTFRYRLRRARELFQLDLDDPDERLLTWLRLRTRRP